MKNDIYLRIRQVVVRTGLSRATIYGMMGRGEFPMKTALGTRAIGWLQSEVEQWMLERKDVVKVGREAAPGRKKIATPKPKKPAQPLVTQGVAPARPAEQNVGLNGWGWGSEAGDVSVVADNESVSDRLRRLHREKQANKQTAPVHGRVVRSWSVVGSPDRGASVVLENALPEEQTPTPKKRQ